MTDQEKQQLFQMLAQGLMQYMAPTLQQFVGQSVAQGVKAGQSMTQECVVNRLAEEDQPTDFVQQRTTPAQLLAEIADTLCVIKDHLEDMDEKIDNVGDELAEVKKKLGRRKNPGG